MLAALLLSTAQRYYDGEGPPIIERRRPSPRELERETDQILRETAQRVLATQQLRRMPVPPFQALPELRLRAHGPRFESIGLKVDPEKTRQRFRQAAEVLLALGVLDEE